MVGGVGMMTSVDSASTTTVPIGVQIENGRSDVVVQGPAVSRRHKPITQAEAKSLTEQIRIGLASVWQLLETAYVDRVWAALGYGSWDAYCASEFGETRIPIPKEERETVVRSLREAGLSYRAIEAGTDMSSRTIRRAAAATGANAPVATTGVNGKTYQPTQPHAEKVEDDVVDAEIVADDDDLIECDTCGDWHAPEVSVCPFLVIATHGAGDESTVYRRPDSVESNDGGDACDMGAENAAAVPAGGPSVDDEDADWDNGGLAGDSVSDADLDVLRKLGEAVQRLVKFSDDDLYEMGAWADSAESALDYLNRNGGITVPNHGMEAMVRESVQDIRQQLVAELARWDSIAVMIEAASDC